MTTSVTPSSKKIKTIEKQSVIIRFAGDSGDGIQVTGDQFTSESAIAGNDLATFPNFPAEIRAPAGTLAGVSGFQINFGESEIFTPGDKPDVLVAMNPAALKANLKDLLPGTIIIANEDAFNEKNLQRVGYTNNPLDSEKFRNDFKVYVVPITKLTRDALEGTSLTQREVDRCKNFFTLGIMLWMFNRPTNETIKWIQTKYGKKPEFVEANIKVLNAGLTYAEATEIFDASYSVKPAKLDPGTYRNINGTTALAYGLIAAAQKSGLPLFFGAYPITPASGLLHELARHKNFDVTTLQAEDEIAAICAAIGASYAGALAVTSSSGPGIALKGEALGLAVCTELPLVIVNIQRAGPSTGMPTKTEQADLWQAMYGRHGEAPLCVLSISSPSSAFEMAYEACRIAIKYMTPVILLSDGFLANSSEPWKLPDPSALPKIEVAFAKAAPDGSSFMPYQRDDKTLARPWAIPGTPGLAHRIGGLEKENITGNISYDSHNHELMTKLRAEKIERIAQDIPPTEIYGDSTGDLLVLGWGGTEGSIMQSVSFARANGMKVSHVQLRYINPFPADLGDVLKRFKHVLIPEINTGQLRSLIRDKYLIDAKGFNVVRGEPIHVSDLVQAITNIVQPH